MFRIISGISRGRLSVLAAALLFSTGGAAIKACALSNWQIASFRAGIAAATLWLMLPGARRGWNWQMVPIGAAYASATILYVLANKLTTSANAIFLQSTAPFYLLLIGPLLLGERIRKIEMAVLPAIAMGAALLLFSGAPAGATAPDPARGNVFAAISGLAWALTVAGLRWMEKRSPGSDAAAATVIVGNLLAFCACLPAALPVGQASGADLGVLIYIGVFQVALAYVFLTRGLRVVTGLEAAILLLVEPVFNPIWTLLIHGERPGTPELAGGALILAAALVDTAWPRTA